jgi:hypothetical protein
VDSIKLVLTASSALGSHQLLQAQQSLAESAEIADQIRYDRAGNADAAGKIAAKRRSIFAPESS